MRIISPLAARRMAIHIEKGNFKKLVGRRNFDSCVKYIHRQASIPHNRKVVLRLSIPYSWRGSDCWYLWAAYLITNNGDPVICKLDSIYIPNNKDEGKVIPEELLGVEYFAS